MKINVRSRLAWIVAGGLAAFGYSLWKGTVESRYSSSIRTGADVQRIARGISAYHTEYGHYPVPPHLRSAQKDQRMEFTGELMDCLLGKNMEGMNPRHVVFDDFLNGIGTRPGVVGGGVAENKPVLDQWGHPYLIVMDTNEDGQIDNPDAKNASPIVRQGAPPTLDLGAAAICCGPDGVDGTGDDVASWRGRIHQPYEEVWYLVQKFGFAGPMLSFAGMGIIQLCLLIKEVIQMLVRRLRQPTVRNNS